ncbi:MAG TPA: hypothetical protein ENK02_10060 [Planctomycetes bacterium]|nr:hypothetical protein [Planctomycetota bacterium]
MKALGSLLLLLSGLLASCAGGGVLSLEELAAEPPLPYRLGIDGGGFLLRGGAGRVEPGGRILASTLFDGKKGSEVIPFERLLDNFRRGRLASSLVVLAEGDPAARAKVARTRGPGADLEALRARARKRGCDLLLVIEGVEDAPVLNHGVNGQWPIASLGWLLIGLGMFVPDHDFEVPVRFKASLRDVYSGKVLQSIVVTPGPFSLSLFQRGSLLGLITSIIVPPPLVGSDPEVVVTKLRRESRRRLILRMLARLKDPQTDESLKRNLPLRLDLLPGRRGEVSVAIRGRQEVLALRFSLDGKPLPGSRQKAAALLATEKREAGQVSYARVLGGLPRRGLLRVHVRDLAGNQVSGSLDLGGRR